MTGTDVTELGTSRADRVWTAVLLGGGGLVLLTASPWLARLLAEVPFVPFSGLLPRVGEYDATWAWIARPLVGLALGLVATVLVLADERRLEVGDEGVVVRRDRDERVLRRDQVVGVYAEGKRVVIDGAQGRTLFDGKVEAKRETVREAFVSHGYPWESH